jgi:outer membrane protein assembly factor BamD (BamD/ComL family)
MKWNSLILSLILAAGVVVAHPTAGLAQTAKDNAEARRLYNEGRDLFDDGNFADAEKKLREAMTKYPKSDQVDRSAYYLIKTLEKLRRYQDANSEIENFYRNYPGSRWKQDVDQESQALGASSNSLLEQEAKIAKERAQSQQLGSTALPPNAGMDAIVLQMMIQQSPNEGIETVKERLKKDPSDPAVIANLGTIYNSRSPLALPFLLDLANSAASPNTRTIAFFYAMRRNPDKAQVANTMMEMLGKKENEPIVSEALFRMTYEEHRAVLAKIVASSNPNKFDAIEKIYRGGSITLRSDLLTAVASLRNDPRAESFIMDAAQNDKDLAVRRAAIEALMSQRDVKSLDKLLTPQPPNATAPAKSTAPVVRAPAAPRQFAPFTSTVPVNQN